jgi:hypothetical protein
MGEEIWRVREYGVDARRATRLLARQREDAGWVVDREMLADCEIGERQEAWFIAQA